MDFSLKQWSFQQHESDDEQHHQSCSKIPRQLLHHSPQQASAAAASAVALPLFVSDHSSTPTAIPTSASSFPKGVGGRYCFSMTQWQELEIQAVIYRHIMAGATVPPHLLQLLKKSLLTSPYYLHYRHHFQPASLLQTGYWGKGAMDPEPGRCRRTDGKKWRCSRDVVAGHKYCERHVHRGRNRSRKPVEFPAAPLAANGGDVAVKSIRKTSDTLNFGAGSVAQGSRFSLSASGAPFDVFQLNTTGSEEYQSDKRNPFDTQHDTTSGDGKSNSKVLMHLFDNWPKSENTECHNGNLLSSTNLSIFTPSNSTSDFLRLSTGNGDEVGRRERNGNGNEEQSWTGGWGGNSVGSMGGPLAEALRSSSNSSPTSVLHQLPRCSALDTSFVSA